LIERIGWALLDADDAEQVPEGEAERKFGQPIVQRVDVEAKPRPQDP